MKRRPVAKCTCAEVCDACKGAGNMWWGQRMTDDFGYPPPVPRPIECWYCLRYGGPLACGYHGLTDRMHHQKLEFVRVTHYPQYSFGTWRCRHRILHSAFVCRDVGVHESPHCNGHAAA